MSVRLYKYLLATIGKALPMSYHPFGTIARKFRYFCAKHIVEYLGKDANIEKGAILDEGVIIEEHGCIGVNCLISYGTKICRHAMMGPECLIYTSNHKFNKELKKYDGYTDIKQVIIEEYAWIGARCIILPGVTIGKGSTVGAGSVVTKSIPPYSVAAGNPAKVIKNLI